MLSVSSYKVGPLQTNCYVIIDQDTNKAAIIDPGGQSQALDDKIKHIGKENIKYILLTHGHFDHIMLSNKYKNLTGAKIAINKLESDFTKNSNLNLSNLFTDKGIQPFNPDILLDDYDVLDLGNTKIKVRLTPGHTRGSSCFIIDDCIFSGDTLMKGCIGRTDFVTGDYNDIKKSLEIFLNMDMDYKIYPGHGDETTLNYEKENNPYFGKVKYEDLY